MSPVFSRRRRTITRYRGGTTPATITERSLASNTATTSSATTLSVSPTGMQQDDWLIFAVVSVGGTSTHTNTAGSLTQIGSGLTQGSTTTLSRWKKKAGASEAGPYTFDVGGTALRIAIAVRAYTGGDTTDIIEESPALTSATAQSLAATGVDPTSTGRWHIIHEASNSAGGTFVSFGAPTNYTEKHDIHSAHGTNANACLGWSERALPTDAATGSQTFTIDGGVNRALVGGSITLKPATSGGGPPPTNQLVLGHWRNRPIDVGTDWRTDHNAAEATFGVFQGHWSTYKGSGSAGTLSAAEITALNDGKNLHVYWKPWSTTWANVASGGRDSVIDAAAASVGARSETIWYTIGHEPENDVGGAGSGMQESDYRAMWQRVRDRFDLAGVDNVTWCWVFQTHLSHPELLPDLWPGNSLVDIVCPQPYINCSATAATLSEKWLDCIQWLFDNQDATHQWDYTHKQCAITEWGADLGGNTAPCGTGDRGTAQHRADAIAGIEDILPDLIAKNVVELRYFDAGSDYLENKPSVDAVAYQSLKDATEA